MQKTLYIAGMHCASCDLIIREAVSGVEGIELIELTPTGTLVCRCPDDGAIDTLQDAIRAHGYGVSTQPQKTIHHRKETALLLIIGVAVWLLLTKLDITSFANDLGGDGSLGYGEMFLLGLIASLSTCLALVGGFVLMRGSLGGVSGGSLRDALRHQGLFQFGRLGGYALGGALLGFIGSAIVFSPAVNGWINLIVSILLLVLGRNMLGRWKISLPSRGGGDRVMELLRHFSQKKRGGVIVGALTFFLPCGFTQVAQITAMSTGSIWQGALLLFIFALGTLPVLLTLGVTGNRFQSKNLGIGYKIVGVCLMVLAIILIQNATRLIGW